MFGDNLREARKSKGYTLEALSDLYNDTFDAGMNKGTLSKYENGKQEPMITVVANLASLLSVPVDSLLGVEGIRIEKEISYPDFSDFERRVLHEYRKADEVDREMVHRILHLNAKACEITHIANGQIGLNAARPRTDLKPEDMTEEMLQHDEDIMDDPNF